MVTAMSLKRALALAGAAIVASFTQLAHAQTASTPPGPTFTGSPSNCNKWYVVADGDNSCSTVEAKFGITHDQFIAWNPAVSRDCVTNFWKGQAYCVGLRSAATSTTSSTSKTSPTSSLPGNSTPAGPTFTGSPSNCNRWWYVVGDADRDCGVVEAKFGITHDQFIAWNPAVSRDCSINFWKGQAYCVGLGTSTITTSRASSSSATRSSSSSMTIITPTTPYSTRFPLTNETIYGPSSTEEWPPSKTQAGQPAYCNNWHFVRGGEACPNIAGLYSTWMTLEDFHAWNPAIGIDCSGLFVHYWVCVGIRPQVQLTMPYETGTASANATIELPPYISFTPAPTPTDKPVFDTPSPTQGQLPANCKAFWRAENGDTCAQAVEEYSPITKEQFLAWHPFLNGNCNGLWAGNWYCTAAFDWDNVPMPPTVKTRPSSVPAGTTGDCVAWYKATPEDTCAIVAQMFGTFGQADFIKWNPSVGVDCSDGVIVDSNYCVAVAGTPTTRTSAVSKPTPPSSAHSPAQDGIASDCSEFWYVSDEDTCATISSQSGVSQDSLKAWNPALGSSCAGLQPDFFICVGRPSSSGGVTTTTTTSASRSSARSSSSSTMSSLRSSSTTSSARSSSSSMTRSAAASPTSSGGSSVPTPAPVQNGMASGCKKFYLVKGGDGCWAIANANGINLSDFYIWNPAVNNGGECAGLWPDYYVCIGK
ncbi:uncharacterized protein B0I36DRAFT_347461 [Microdochium trichocladiopsis]|uniref:LysM domain-containing protein n=1 Tax=Microdochium trichocladiopsis TaxID=1682393 RepID=A0A9P8YEZ2_9PEZI|nr:uncharacterized protein B0I36DRAFT_347461 [Microdochium trichocladiopsis]KAH7035726.1 hypothetical protein B0I36DRAFT_347461 [Microdochium trichocladiopsis]